MVEDKTKIIGITTLISLLLITAATVGPDFFDEPKYFCENRPELGYQICDEGFSKYVSSKGKCLNSEDPNLICREGWKLITNDLTIDPPKHNFSMIIGDDGIARETVIMGVK